MAFSPCREKSLSNAQTTASVSLLREPRVRPAYHVGRNLVIERRYAAGDPDQLQALAGDLVRGNVDVIVTENTPAAAAAKRATGLIPIVMATGGDAVGAGLVASLARPGGNVTGMSALTSQLDGKKPELLRELKPDAKRLAFIGNSQIAAEQTGFREVEKSATAGSRNTVTRSMMRRLLVKNSGVARTFSAWAPDALALSIAGAISSSLVTPKTESSTPRACAPSCSV